MRVFWKLLYAITITAQFVAMTWHALDEEWTAAIFFLLLFVLTTKPREKEWWS